MAEPVVSVPAGPAVPRRWKLWVLVVLAVYPLITAIATLAAPLLDLLPLYLRFAVLVPVLVALMLWLVVPLLHRWFGRWLVR